MRMEDPMSVEHNIATVRRYYQECANDGDPDKTHALVVVNDLLSTDFAMAYNAQRDGAAGRGRDTHQAFLTGHAQAFPGEHWTIEAIVADDQLVACRWRVQATHAETGNPVDLRGADFFTIRHGQLAELRRFLDFATLREQMQPTSAQQAAST